MDWTLRMYGREGNEMLRIVESQIGFASGATISAE